jgi:hypothetical protein
MEEFEPSRDFVARVMKGVHALEQKQRAQLLPRLVASKAGSFACAAGAILLGLLNFMRFYYTLFSPVICR